MSYTQKVGELLTRSGKMSLSLNNVLFAIQELGKENEDDALIEVVNDALLKKREFDQTMVDIINYLKNRESMR